jgi:arabinofuranosyltransferase
VKEKHWTWLILGLIALAMGYAWLHRHAEDDAFITFRYSKHLVDGLGPVWNADQRVEGYTNFLWMCLMAVPIALGLDPLLPSVLVALLFLGLNLWLTHRIALRLAGDPKIAFLLWLPVLCNHTLLIFATSGLETTMNGCLWTLAIWQMQRILCTESANPRQFLGLGLILAACSLSRPEGALLVAASLTALGIVFRNRIPWGSMRRLLLALSAVLVPWLAWKWAFYGGILPNTFYVKAASGVLVDGLRYAVIFLVVSGIWLPRLLFYLSRKGTLPAREPFLVYAGGLTISFLAYVTIVGGDYLEFRLLTPVLPMALLIPLYKLWRRSHAQYLYVASVGMVVLALFWGQGHGRLFKVWQLNSVVHPVDAHALFMSFSDQGKALGALLGHDPTIRLAIGACGSIPYYSGFYGIDLYGLNEPREEFKSRPTVFGPGHGGIGNLTFIRQKRPHLISLRCEHIRDIDQPRSYSTQDPQVIENLGESIPQSLLDSMRVIELPLQDGFVEVCIYYQPHPRIDAAIKNNRLTIYSLEKK